MTAVVDARIPLAAEQALRDRGFAIVKLPPHPALPAPIASHPDMLIFFAQDAVFCTKSYYVIAKNELEKISRAAQRPLITLKKELGATYPRDILLNAAPVGQYLFCLSEYTADEIREGFRVIPVKQGYAKCSTVPVGESSIITADPSIARAAQVNGIDTLTVRAGHVTLSGYDTGFLGGTSSFAPYGDTNEVFFCGDLTKHPDHAHIRAFCHDRGFETVSLSNEPLTDVGTIFLIEGV